MGVARCGHLVSAPKKFADDREPHSAPAPTTTPDGRASPISSAVLSATASAAASSTASALWTYLDVIVSNERGDRRFGISKVGRERRVAMAQDMRSHVGGQSAKLRDPRPKLRKAGHATLATRSWKHKLAGLGQNAQHVTGGA